MKYPRKVYAIRHNTTNKVYIGSSCNVDRRFLQHLYALRSHKHPVWDMQKDFNEHGEDYTMTILDTIKDASESEKEYEWMEKYQSFVQDIGYNYQDVKVRRKGKAVAEEKAPTMRHGDLTDDERELLHIIKTAKNPTLALIDAVLIIAQFIPPPDIYVTMTSQTT